MSHLRYAVLLLLALAALLPAGARAACSFTSGNTSNVNMSFSQSTITIDPNAPVGTVLASTGQFSPSTISEINCTGNNTKIGVVNLVGSQPATTQTIFPTAVAGVGYRITHPDTSSYLTPYGGDTIASGAYEMSVTSGLELVKTGTIANGTVISAGTLGYWRYDNNLRTENFILSRSVTLTYPTCSVTNKTINVVLPTVSNTAFNGIGTTAGATAFNIALNCSNGDTLAIEFNTSNQSSAANSVIANATGGGRAKNIGVQLLNQTFVPVTFGATSVVGITPDGPLNLTYYARYYQTANAPTAGTVSTTATFTLTYP